jgi:hypothetical protein
MTDIDTSSTIRIAAGFVSPATILGSSSYLVSEFPIQSDNTNYPYWEAIVDGGIRDGSIVRSLSGSGGLYGKYSGTLTLSRFTPDMQAYWFTTIMQNKYVAPVTIYFYHPRYKFMTLNCYLSWFENIADNGTQQTNVDWTNVTMTWDRGVALGNAYSSAYSEAYS